MAVIRGDYVYNRFACTVCGKFTAMVLYALYMHVLYVYQECA